MEEKKPHSKFLRKIFILVLLSIVFVSFFTIIRGVREQTTRALIESWILLGSRGYFGNIEAVSDLSGSLELIGDSHYRRGNIDGAKEAYRRSLKIQPDDIIELKLALLEVEKNNTGNTDIQKIEPQQSSIESTLSRIENDAQNREKYFRNNTNFGNISPIFERSNKEVIDW